MATDKKTTMNIRISEDEKNVIKEQADRIGMSVSEYVLASVNPKVRGYINLHASMLANAIAKAGGYYRDNGSYDLDLMSSMMSETRHFMDHTDRAYTLGLNDVRDAVLNDDLNGVLNAWGDVFTSTHEQDMIYQLRNHYEDQLMLYVVNAFGF